VLASQASTANARIATLWACHGPDGTPLGVAGLAPATTGDGIAAIEDGGCATPGMNAAGTIASFSRSDPIGGSSAGWHIDVPGGATLQRIRIARGTRSAGGPATAGSTVATASTADAPAASSGRAVAFAQQRYELRTSSEILESESLFDTGHDLLGMFTAQTGGSSVELQTSCDGAPDLRCAAVRAGAVSVGTIALDVDDSQSPTGAVGGFRSPASGTLLLAIAASDEGVGLASATATVDGATAATVRLGAQSCDDLSTTDPAVDLPAGGACPATVSAIPLPVDLTPYAVGRHQLQVRVADAVGNSSVILDEAFDVAGPPPVYTPSVSLQIGNGGDPADSGSAALPSQKVVPVCLVPRLSMALDQRPLRVTPAGVPVLRAGRRYRFRGRLTCRVKAGRRSAPIGVPVSLVSRRGPGGRLVASKTGVVTRRTGRLTLIMSYRSSREMMFRYRSADGTSTYVQIAIVVAHAAKRTAR
jgi:hypothetical protein